MVVSKVICKYCSDVFVSKGKYQSHYRLKHQKEQCFQFDRNPYQSTDQSKKQSIDWPAEALANRSTFFEPRSNRSIDKSDRSVNQLDKIRFGNGVEMWLILAISWAHTWHN